MGLAWGVGFFLTEYLFIQNNFDPNPIKKLFFGLFISSFLGAKVFFLWFSSGHKIYQYLYANYFWMGGGFVFYGGLIFGLAFYLIYSLIFKKFNFSNSAILLPGLIFGHAVGRIGCFLAGCCYGNKTTSILSVYMHDEFRYPVQLYEALSLSILGILVLNMIKCKKDNQTILSTYLIGYSLIRIMLEFLRGDEIRGTAFNLFSTSQIISMVILTLGILTLKIQKKTI